MATIEERKGELQKLWDEYYELEDVDLATCTPKEFRANLDRRMALMEEIKQTACAGMQESNERYEAALRAIVS